MDDEDTEEQEGLAAGSYQVSAVALFFVLEALMTDGKWRRDGSKLSTFEHVRACFAALWGWPLSGEKPVSAICFRCEQSKVTLLLDRLVVDQATLAESDTPGVGVKAARNRAIRTHSIRGRCFSVRYLFVPLFFCFSIQRNARTIIRRNARAWFLLLVFLCLHGEKSGESYGEKPGHPCGEQPGHAFTPHVWSS